MRVIGKTPIMLMILTVQGCGLPERTYSRGPTSHLTTDDNYFSDDGTADEGEPPISHECNKDIDFPGLGSAQLVDATSAKIIWTNLAEAASYNLYEIREDKPNLLTELTKDVSEFILHDLEPTKTYKFRLRAKVDEREDCNEKDVAITTLDPNTPALFSDLVFWFRSDDLLGIPKSSDDVADGTPIGAWIDKSMNPTNALQPTALLQPVLRKNAVNGHHAVHFAGSGQYLSGELKQPLTLPFTLTVVGQFGLETQPDGDNDYLFNMGKNNDVLRNLSISRSSGDWEKGADLFYTWDGDDRFAGPTLVGKKWMTITIIANAQAPFLELLINGARQPIDDLDGGLSIEGTFELGRYISNKYFLNGDIAEAILVQRQFSEEQSNLLHCYLTVRYAIETDANVCLGN